MKYLLTYWAERNDEATDVEIIITANSLEEAKTKFLNLNIVHKKIDKIIEYDL
jgi:hypothetical protein